MLNDTKLVNVMMTLRIAVIFILALLNLILAGPLKGLVEENFVNTFMVFTLMITSWDL